MDRRLDRTGNNNKGSEGERLVVAQVSGTQQETSTQQGFWSPNPNGFWHEVWSCLHSLTSTEGLHLHCEEILRKSLLVPSLMALSFYSNWGTLESLEPEVFPEAQPELAKELLGFQDSFLIPDTCLDQLLEPNDLFFSETYSQLHPFISPSIDHSNALTSELFPPQVFESYVYAKRQKIYENHSFSDLVPSLFDGFVPNPPLLPEFLPAAVHHVPSLDLHSLAVYNSVSNETSKKPNGGSLSVQSIAARQRRRKITEKTQELGKLIPGGNKMNTAEMFQAAFKYVKYLQAQVGILGVMASIQGDKEESRNQELQALASSRCIQEKLYSTEKCLVPSQFVQTLPNNSELQSNSLIVEELVQFIRTNLAE
ncbi:transcription factor bHLH52-like [Diospyros lotus]|uniref:transcription factor bHLH52-like n=1 Tax=Diospyros lotus TaxID=55363 RepID=UPI00224FE308|nr:transcription factor bHLH52-like [Diospyros lotus]